MPDEKSAADAAPARLAKLLPADLTAAFLSVKAGLLSALGDPNANGPIFWTFVGILLISPFYFRWVVKAQTRLQVTFLSVTFVIFAISIAQPQFSSYLTQYKLLSAIDFPLTAIAIVLPILWVFLVAPIVEDVQASKKS
jgi:hypothetical protein